MTEYIEIKFLSPVSNYIFTKDDIIYVLVVTTTDSFGEIHINKIIVKEINNIDNFIRAYAVKKSIKVLPSLFGSYLNIKLFSRDIIENRIILLFSGQIQTEKCPSKTWTSPSSASASACLGPRDHHTPGTSDSFPRPSGDSYRRGT